MLLTSLYPPVFLSSFCSSSSLSPVGPGRRPPNSAACRPPPASLVAFSRSTRRAHPSEGLAELQLFHRLRRIGWRRNVENLNDTVAVRSRPGRNATRGKGERGKEA